MSNKIDVGVKTQYISIPQNLLEIEYLKKPVIKSETDILNAYASLFGEYSKCVVKIEAVKKLNEKWQTEF